MLLRSIVGIAIICAVPGQSHATGQYNDFRAKSSSYGSIRAAKIGRDHIKGIKICSDCGTCRPAPPWDFHSGHWRNGECVPCGRQ